MTIDELGDWEETWAEELYKRDYENLPDFMIDALCEYSEYGGTAEEFNKRYSFGSNNMTIKKVRRLVKNEFN